MSHAFRVRPVILLVAVAALAGSFVPAGAARAQGGIIGRIKAKAAEKITKKTDSTADSDAKGKKGPSADSAQSSAKGGGPADITAYQNYDFVPGDTIVFEDDFKSDETGELPAHWKLVDGQGAVNNVNGTPTMVLTDGLDARLAPRIKSTSYLGETFTIEFDFLPAKEGWEGMKVTMLHLNESHVGTSVGDVRFDPNGGGAHVEFPREYQFSGDYPPLKGKSGGEDTFWEHWHHGAIAYKNHTMKVYIDQYRVVTAPDVPVTPTSVEFGGRTSGKVVRFTNVRIANGGDMKLVDKLTKNGRIITHGILFDVDKSSIKPQSMGTINQIVAMLKADPSLKFEIGGHTDSDGDAAHNMALSQARADAVKKILVDQGVDASRLTTKGYGATTPIASNDTPEGKANNRRVEFVKQ